jgi:hypothetical protein
MVFGHLTETLLLLLVSAVPFAHAFYLPGLWKSPKELLAPMSARMEAHIELC